MNTLEKEKADLQNQLGLMNEEVGSLTLVVIHITIQVLQVRQVNMRRDELEEALSFKDNEIVALMAQVETEKNAAENAAMELRQLAEGQVCISTYILIANNQDASFREQLLKKEKAFNIELANERAKLMEKEKKCNEVSVGSNSFLFLIVFRKLQRCQSPRRKSSSILLRKFKLIMQN